MRNTIQIKPEVQQILQQSIIAGNSLTLPKTQLPRPLYLEVNKILEALGGKWNRKTQSHIFETSPADLLASSLDNGHCLDEKKEYQFFETPGELAREMVAIANIMPGESVLEPSAGRGAIARYLPNPTCVELNPKYCKDLEQAGYNVYNQNFLTYNKRHDVIIANPPFSNQQNIDHVTHMIGLANRIVVAVMGAGIQFRDNKKTNKFRDLLESCYFVAIEDLPEKTFNESGTNVKSCLVTIRKY